jgi:hypothetical protein
MSSIYPPAADLAHDTCQKSFTLFGVKYIPGFLYQLGLGKNLTVSYIVLNVHELFYTCVTVIGKMVVLGIKGKYTIKKR